VRCFAATPAVSMPTEVDPVRLIRPRSGWEQSQLPTVEPRPVTISMAPSGDSGLHEKLAQPDQGERIVCRWFHDGGIPHDERGRDLLVEEIAG